LPLRLVFMGTPDFAVPTLLELVGAGHDIAAVYTRAPQPAGRGMELRPSPIAREASRFGFPVVTPKTLRTADAAQLMRAHSAEAAVVVAYGLLLPMLRCCRVGAARPRSIAPSWPATLRPGSW
jgi:methionyl-tRNA formyltransferase